MLKSNAKAATEIESAALEAPDIEMKVILGSVERVTSPIDPSWRVAVTVSAG